MGVRKTVIVAGTGSRPRRGQTVTIEYTGWLKDDTQPDGRGEV
jgi:FK506-binding protein 1